MKNEKWKNSIKVIRERRRENGKSNIFALQDCNTAPESKEISTFSDRLHDILKFTLLYSTSYILG